MQLGKSFIRVVVFFFGCFCLLFLVGCNKIDRKTNTGQVITITTWESELVGDAPDVKVAREIRDEFDRNNPQIKVNRLSKPTGEERKVFATAMAGGTGPDLAEIPGVDTRTYIEQGFAADITDLLEEWGELDNIFPIMLEPVIKDERYYGIPREYYMMLLAYRTDLYGRAGLDPQKPPRNWEELADYAKRLTNRAENRYGYGMIGMDYCGWHFMDYVWQAGGDFMRVDPKSKKMIATFQEKPGIQALQFYKDLRWKYDVIQNNVLQDLVELINDFITGRSAMYKFYAQDMPSLIRKGLTIDKIGLAPLPEGPAKVRASQMAPRVYIINPTISKEKQKAAFEYIKYNISRETMIKRWKLQEKYGILSPAIPIWKGLLQSNSIDFPVQWSKAIEKQTAHARLEPYFPYWDKVKQALTQPIQAILLNKHADPAKEMRDCAQRVQKDFFDKTGSVEYK